MTTVRELIIALLEHPMDAEVVRKAGEDEYANVSIVSLAMGETYLHPETTGTRKRTRKTLVLR